MVVLQNAGYHVAVMNVCDQGDWRVSQRSFWFPKQTPTFPSMSKLSGEQWLMNSWYEFLTLLESRNMLMNSGRSPNICKVMTKVVMNYSWLAYSCSEAQRFIPVYIQHLWPSSGSPLHIWKVVGVWRCYKHSCRTGTHGSTSAWLHDAHIPSQGSQDFWLPSRLQDPSYLQGKVHKQLHKHRPRESRYHREGGNWASNQEMLVASPCTRSSAEKTKADEGERESARPVGTARFRIRSFQTGKRIILWK